MQIKIAVEPLNENLPQSEHKSVRVSTLTLRGDAWLTQKVDSVMCDGKDVVFNVPDGAQLHLATPRATEDVVFDVAQGAAIHKSQQETDENRADRPNPRDVAPVDTMSHDAAVKEAQRQQAEAEAARIAREREVASTGSQGGDSRSPAERAASLGTTVPPQTNAAGGRIINPASQQPAVKTADEKTTLPGSSTAPHQTGNEGKDK